MSHSNRVAGLLTGVSLATLSFLTGRGTALAAGTTLTGSGSKTISTNFDYVNIENPANFTLVTNDATISDGSDNPLFTPGVATAVNIASSAVVDQFVNNSVIRAVIGTKTANGSPAQHATATGLFDHNGSTLITNNGLIQGLAVAHPPGSSQAAAVAFGIRQTSTGVTSAHLTVINSGRVKATANATVIGVFDASANARATAVYQRFVASTGSASITNNAGGLIAAAATAIASGSDQARAIAAAVGALQEGTGNGSFLAASVKVVNNATISALAKASAHGFGVNATAAGTAAGVMQRVFDVPIGSALVTNTGLIQGLANAAAFALGSGNAAVARATAIGVHQAADEAEGAAYLTVNNVGGTIRGRATAFASATSGYARASASGVGVKQTSGDAGVFNALVTNSAGGLIAGFAKATAIGTSAHASATARGVVQSSYSENRVAILTVANSGQINAQAVAAATAFGINDDANVRANAIGVYQSEEDAIYLGASVTNDSGAVISGLAVAAAHASAASGYAGARATAAGVHQTGYSVTGVNFSVVNSGTISGQASALAVAMASLGDAFARASAEGVHQFLDSGEAIIATVTNNAGGVIQGIAMATARAASEARASAYAAGVHQSSYGVRSSNFSVVNSGHILAQANALAVVSRADDGFAEANALAYGVEQFAGATSDVFAPGTAYTALVTNSTSGVISALAQAVAHAHGSAGASANASAFGVSQYASFIDAVNFTVQNSGKISATAQAQATSYQNDVRAEAFAIGVLQGAFHGGSESESAYTGGAFTASVTNSGGITANAQATAVGDAAARATAVGVSQYATGYGAMNFAVNNSGNILAGAKALAVATTGDAQATAKAIGVGQFGINFGSMNAVVTNVAHAIISAHANAKASALTTGLASASAKAFGVSQNADRGGLADLSVHNSGNIQGLATAVAVSLHGNANATAYASGVFQSGFDVAGLTATVTNDAGGSIYAAAKATAVGAFFADASAVAFGVQQTADEVGVANLTLNNSGTIGALAQAAANGTHASATARAVGAWQSSDDVYDPSSTVHNSGLIKAAAFAKAVGTTFAFAKASATGIGVRASTLGAPFTIDIANSGDIRALAKATALAAHASASQYAAAGAFGIFASANGIIDGTIKNSGHIWASAFAQGASGYAFAVGIWDPSAINNTTITNTGLINAYAQVANAGLNGGTMAAYATGILISAQTSADPPGKTTVINDGGTIWAGTSQDGGKTIQRGNAINTTGISALNIPPAPNGVAIALEGNSQPSHIFGDILITSNDEVDVFNGKTFFDGILNNPNKVTQVVPSAGYPFVGTFNLQNGGKLVLCQEGWSGACDSGAAAWANAGPGGAGFNPANANNGPSYLFTNSFSMGSSSTLAYQLTPMNTPSSANGFFTNPPGGALTSFTPGSYSQVFTNTAHLSGTLQALYLPGFYGNATTYQHVVEAGTLSGGFASVTDNSILLNTTADVHPGSPGFVNLNVTRTAFGSVSGLTQNQSSAGGGIEKVYGQLPSPGTNPATLGSSSQAAFDKIVANLFTIDNAADYGKALDQLSGSQYAQQLQSVIWSTRELNQTITDRMECQIDGTSWQGGGGDPKQHAAATPGCFKPGQWTLWAQGHGSWDHQKGDNQAPGYNEGQFGGYLGADYAFTPDWFLGAAGGYFSSRMDFNNWGGVSGGSINYDGFQIAGYGGYDDRVQYARGVLAFGGYTGNSTRFVSIAGTPVDPHGSPDAGVLSFYGEAGRRFDLSSNWVGTPFVGLSVARGWLSGFTESDEGTGANLAIHDSSGTSVASRVGGRLSTVWGAFSPEVSLAWQHEFGSTTQTVNASFASAPAGADFSVISANTGRDGAALAAGISYALGPQNKISVQYDGFYTGDYYSNAVMARWTAKW